MGKVAIIIIIKLNFSRETGNSGEREGRKELSTKRIKLKRTWQRGRDLRELCNSSHILKHHSKKLQTLTINCKRKNFHYKYEVKKKKIKSKH